MHRRYLQGGADHSFTPVARTGPGRQHFGDKNLSTSARVRCFEQLTRRVEWLFAGADAAVARRRQSILAAGRNERLMTRFAEFMENYQSSQRSKHSPPAGGDLPALLEAYSRVNRVRAREGQWFKPFSRKAISCILRIGALAGARRPSLRSW
ncbi:hypothetical protein NKH23_25465 [Mesorhizobium sp. M1328]|uniref:hypothetical protein n=1 Tax=Mesorhizobium sp. M1328 TaxID=2957082 RepID=UPI00333BBE71